MATSQTSKTEQPNGMIGLAQFLAEPALDRLLALEPWLKRSIPILILVFLSIVFSARVIALMSDRDEAAQNAHMFLSVLSDMGAGAIDSAERAGFAPQTPADFDRILARALPTQATVDERVLMITDREGEVLSQRGGRSTMVGRSLIGRYQGVQPLMMFGGDAGVVEIVRDERRYVAAAARIGDGEQLFVALQPESAIYGPWRQRLSMNVALFVAMSSILLILLYAYFGQVARAREADQVYCETHKRMDLALARGHCGLWDWDLARGRIYWSRSMFDLLGYAPVNDVLSFGEVADLVHPEDADLFDLAERAAAMEITGVDRIMRMRHAKGHYVRLRIRTELAESPGQGNHLIGIAVDMTEQHRLTELTQMASRNLKAAIESSSESFALWDRDGKLVLSNRKFLEINGLTDADVQPGAKRTTLDKMVRKPVTERRIPQGGDDDAVTLERQIADGRWMQINERVTPGGGTISVGTDITQLKLQEERLIDSERRLMASIQDLSVARQAAQEKALALEEMNTKFLDAKDRAEAANKTKTEFLANVSHELRTPLNAIIGFSQMMQQRMFGPLGSERYDEYIADIHDSGAFLLNVIDDILDMSKIEAGRLVLDVEPIDLAPLITEASHMLSVPAQAKSITIDQDIAPQMHLHADRRAMKQILINLLTNAVKFTKENGHIRIRAKIDGSMARILIADDGCGIPYKALRRLGRPFEQVQNQFSKTHTGSGLGLAISKSLAELHGGYLGIRSKPDQGTVVVVRVPIDGPPAPFGAEGEQAITEQQAAQS